MSAPSKKEELFQYVLVIKKEKDRSIDLVSILLCLISWIYFLYRSLNGEKFLPILFYSSFLVPVVLGWTEWIRRSFQKKTGFKTALFVTGLIWLLVPGFRWVIVLFLFFILLEHQSRVPLEVGISHEQVVINTFFRKRYSWSEISNIILKDQMLTIDFRNNRILQREIFTIGEDSEEHAFNLFCKQQVLNHR